MKSRQVLLTIVAAAAVLAPLGCGPTKTGIENRDKARARIGAYNAKYTYDQAKQEFEVGQLDRAMKNIQIAIGQMPEEAAFYLLRGRIQLEQHELSKAEESFKTALGFDPQYAQAYYFSGIVHQRWSNYDDALAMYQAAYDNGQDHAEYLQAVAETYIELGQLEEARHVIESRLDFFENAPTLRHLLGQIALLDGDPAQAAELYGEARLLDPDNLQLMEELAWAQYDAQLHAECYDTLKALQARLEEPRLDLKHLEARCLTMLGRTQDAHQLYMELSRKNPSHAALWIEFGTVAWKVGDYRRVAQCSVRAIALEPDRFEGYMLKGLYERHEGRFDDAIALLRQAAELCTDTAMPALLLGRTLEQNGDNQAALVAYGEAVDAYPSSRDARALYTELDQKLRIATAEEE